MNTKVIKGKFKGLKKTYISKNGFHYFWFDFIKKNNHINIICNKHPSFNGQSSSVSKTHIWPSGKICFLKGKEPRSKWEAKKRAKQWAEYILEYRRTGKAQS